MTTTMPLRKKEREEKEKKDREKQSVERESRKTGDAVVVKCVDHQCADVR